MENFLITSSALRMRLAYHQKHITDTQIFLFEVCRYSQDSESLNF